MRELTARFDDRTWKLLDALRAGGVSIPQATISAIEETPAGHVLAAEEVARLLIAAMPEHRAQIQGALAEPALDHSADGTNKAFLDQVAAAKKSKASNTEIEMYALRVVSALRKMDPDDRAAVMAAVPASLGDAAELIGGRAGADLQDIARIENKIRDAIIENDDKSALDDAFLAALRTRDTIIHSMREGLWQHSVVKGGVPLRELLFESGISPGELRSIAEQLELLQDLGGEKDLTKMDAKTKGALATFNALNVPDLIRHAGQDLAAAFFRLLEQVVRDEHAIER